MGYDFRLLAFTLKPNNRWHKSDLMVRDGFKLHIS